MLDEDGRAGRGVERSASVWISMPRERGYRQAGERDGSLVVRVGSPW
jgi:hypothetical protein